MTLVISIMFRIVLGFSAVFSLNYISDMTLMTFVEITSLKGESISKEIGDIYDRKVNNRLYGYAKSYKTY